ncbi:EamA family transporter [Amycolatopsis magusensis]|uniref:Drug/metabolite transporter (DMT)-like permease n=1 Tax=Amycolatopsis magusensis TaxID=882444 RepID=A0ABS4PY92_9PSEU|nr:EamA family transporter [Amycolatopsis magusensis]MBP2184396.1 drug/metabolite transporter (DMT)-like permease [Amycolatopsis magusensis]
MTGDARPSWLIGANLLVLYVVWGSTYLAIRVMVETIPPLSGAGIRFLVAGVLLHGWCVARTRRWFPVSRQELRGAAVIGVLIIGGGLGLLTLGERTVPSGVAALVIASMPLWVAVFRLLARERPRPVVLLGLLAGFSGVAILLAPSGWGGPVAFTGLVIVLAAAIAEAIGSFFTPRVRLPGNALLSAGVQMLVAGPLLIVVGLLAGEDPNPASWSGASWWALLYLIGPGSILAFGSLIWLLTHAPVSVATTYAYVNPAIALVLGWLILDEHLTPGILGGGALIIVAVILVLWGERRPAESGTRASTPEAEDSRSAGKRG